MIHFLSDIFPLETLRKKFKTLTNEISNKNKRLLKEQTVSENEIISYLWSYIDSEDYMEPYEFVGKLNCDFPILKVRYSYL